MFILFNGPPRSGKDTAARFAMATIEQMGLTPIWEKFSRPNKEAFAAMMDADIDDEYAVKWYEAHKEEVVPHLGVSYRQWQIDFSEKFMKPLYGNDIFGRLLRERCPVSLDAAYVVSDCGFQIEVDALAERRCLLITLKRDGCDFSKDSREYVKPAPNWEYHVLQNDKSLDYLRGLVETLVGDFVNGAAP